MIVYAILHPSYATFFPATQKCFSRDFGVLQGHCYNVIILVQDDPNNTG